MPSVCKTPEAQKRCQRRDKRWLWGQRRGCAIVLQMGAAATLSRSDLPLPASGPRHSHVGPAPPSAPPASGTAAAGPEADHFLLPCAQPGSNLHATGHTTRSRVAPSLGPALPPATERARSGSLAISGAHGFLLPLVFSSSSSMLPSPCSGCGLPPLTPAKHPN